MQISREFKHKLIEVCYFKIGFQLPKLWNLEVRFVVPILNSNGIAKKSNMKMG